jgi:hypothetical protein
LIAPPLIVEPSMRCAPVPTRAMRFNTPSSMLRNAASPPTAAVSPFRSRSSRSSENWVVISSTRVSSRPWPSMFSWKTSSVTSHGSRTFTAWNGTVPNAAPAR